MHCVILYLHLSFLRLDVRFQDWRQGAITSQMLAMESVVERNRSGHTMLGARLMLVLVRAKDSACQGSKVMTGIAEQIHSGTLSKGIAQPYDMKHDDIHGLHFLRS